MGISRPAGTSVSRSRSRRASDRPAQKSRSRAAAGTRRRVGIEQRPRRSRATSMARSGPPSDQKISTTCARPMIPQAPAPGARAAVRIAAAVPVLVHREDRLGDGLGQADHAGNPGAALAAHREDLGAAALGAADGELAELPHPRHQRAAAPMSSIACAICSGTRRQSRIHTARLTSWSQPPNRSQTSEALAEQPASLSSSA